MTRGQDGSLLLSCIGLSPTITCQFVLAHSPLYLTPKTIGAIDRPLAGNYPGVPHQYSLLPCFATMRASVWSAPIQNRINRNQGTIHTSCTYPPFVRDALCGIAHTEKNLREAAKETVFEMQSVAAHSRLKPYLQGHIGLVGQPRINLVMPYVLMCVTAR